MRFLLLDRREAFFGGAAGGGKSDSLLMGASMYLDTPGYNAMLFRRTLQEHNLAEGLIPRSVEWWGGKAKWNGQDYRWKFPSGATVSFGYMAASTDHFRYQSAAFQYIGFDELSHFEEQQYRYMFSRLRRLEGVDIPLRMRSASNPGGVGHDWVKRRFIAPGSPDRPFIPSRLEDNPYLDRSSYVESLKELNPITREQLLNGDWEIRPAGSMIDPQDFIYVQGLPYEKNLRGIRYWDLAATDEAEGGDPAYTAGVLMLTSGDGVYYIRDVKRARLRPGEVEKLVFNTAVLDQQLVLDLKVRSIITWMEQEPGASGKSNIEHYARSVLQGFAFMGDKVTGSKTNRAQPFAAAVANRNVCIVRGEAKGEGRWVEPYVDECAAFPESKYKDQVDASSGAYQKLIDVSRPAKAGFI